jgi:signal transduction histidine kinase
MTLVEPLADEEGVSLQVSSLRDGDAQVDGEATLQVLTNLLVNAIQAMPGGGTVNVSMDVQCFDAPPERRAEPGEFVCISVKDEGVGIAPEVLDHVFEPFFTTKEAGEGTGLGLSVSHQLAREHGGWIAAESEPGKGSCFRVYLPIRGSA